MQRVQVGIRPAHELFDPAGHAHLRDFLAAAEAAGLDHLCVGDHVSFKGGHGYDGLIQATALVMLSRLPVHTAVYLLLLRHPVAVARQVSSLTSLAPGRLVFGVGLGGDDPHELEVCGVDPRTRGRRMDECLTVLRALLAGERVDFDGEHIAVHDARVLPPPPMPVPIMIGGRSDAAIGRTARFGHGWLGLFVTPDRYGAARRRVEEEATGFGRPDVEWQHGLTVWCGFGDSQAEAEGRVGAAMEALYQRPFADFARYAPHGAPDDVAAALAPYVAEGCSIFNLIPVAGSNEEAIEGVARVRSALTR
jgi:alkanesulfonate monooxygenase SsuD/methylene tetrahydromethanopterin reductase-like flavin-dependent oxidoreductase (luciferase family)